MARHTGKKHPYGTRTDEVARERREEIVRSVPARTEVLIDADVNPHLPPQLQHGAHRQLGKGTLVSRDGELYFAGKKITLVSCDNALGVMRSEVDLIEDIPLSGQNPLNANFRDALRENSTLIPKEWSGKYIFFPGTWFVLTPGGDRYIPFLYESGKGNWLPHVLPAPQNPKDTFFGKNAYIAVF